MRLPAQFAPKRCATSDNRLTIPGRSLPITVNTSDFDTTTVLGMAQRANDSGFGRERRADEP